MKTLVADDEFISRLLMQKIFSSYGECLVTVNGQQTVDAFKLALEEKRPYDLVCLDIRMPVMDGNEALKKIRQVEIEYNIQSDSKVKIIMVTAFNTSPEVVEEYYKEGCTAFVMKPVEKCALLEMAAGWSLIQL